MATATSTTTPKTLRMVELCSSIGGFHLALQSVLQSVQHSSASWRESTLRAHAFDNNCHANRVYAHNFGVAPIAKNIEHLSAAELDALSPTLLTLSPPCQPYTRAGKAKGAADARSNALRHFCERLLPEMEQPPHWIMLENVVGFERSESYRLFVESLTQCGYRYAVYAIDPTQLGLPNTRRRIYVLATATKKTETETEHSECEGKIEIIDAVNAQNIKRQRIGDVIGEEKGDDEAHLRLVQRLSHFAGYRFDVVTVDDVNSECFTKAYATKKKFVKGTGALFASKVRAKEQTQKFRAHYARLCAKKQNDKVTDKVTDKVLRLLSAADVGLRFFSPKEMSLLMGFPEHFAFPKDVTDAQRYRLIGNSVSVPVVAYLLSILLADF